MGHEGATDETAAHHGDAELQPHVRYFRTARATDYHVPSPVTEALSSGRISDRVALASDPTCPIDVMGLLAADSPAVGEALAAHPRLPVYIQQRLATSTAGVATILLDNPVLDAAIFAPLVETALKSRWEFPWNHRSSGYGARLDSGHLEFQLWYEVTRRALADPRCPTELLRRYWRHDYFAVRGAVVANPTCPTEVLAASARRFNDSNSEPIAANPATSIGTLAWILANTGYQEVREAVLDAAADRPAEQVRELLLTLRQARRQDVLRLVPEETMQELETDSDERIRYSVAVGTRDAKQLNRLSRDPHGRVRRAASRRLLHLLAA